MSLALMSAVPYLVSARTDRRLRHAYVGLLGQLRGGAPLWCGGREADKARRHMHRDVAKVLRRRHNRKVRCRHAEVARRSRLDVNAGRDVDGRAARLRGRLIRVGGHRDAKALELERPDRTVSNDKGTVTV